MKAPVLLIGHTRPDEIARVIEAILSVAPERVYVATDGPRPGMSADLSLCREVQEVVRSAAWPGQVQYLASEENLGPRLRIPSAIDWAFREVDRLIILEDDCVPDPTFFRYCEVLLDRYRNDPGVMTVSGTNPAPWRRGPSYRFSSYAPLWGWATWTRAWQHFGQARRVVNDRSIDLRAVVDRAWRDPAEQDYWAKIYGGLREGGARWSDAGWDYEWNLAQALNRAVAAIPRANIVTNVGFGKHASNTHDAYLHPVGRMRMHKLRFPLVEPERVRADEKLDAVLRAGHLETAIPGFRGRARRAMARVRGKIDYTLKRNEFGS